MEICCYPASSLVSFARVNSFNCSSRRFNWRIKKSNVQRSVAKEGEVISTSNAWTLLDRANFKFRENSRISERSKIFDAEGFYRRMGPPRRWSCPPLAAPSSNPTDPSFFAFGDVHRLFRTILTRAIARIGDIAERNRRQNPKRELNGSQGSQ